MPETPRDLSCHVCLGYSHHPFGENWQFDGPGGCETVHVSGTLRSNSPEGLRLAAVLGQGLIIAPSFMVAAELKSGRLVAVLGEFLGAETPIEVFYQHRDHLPAKVRAFIDLLVKRIPDQAEDWKKWD